MGILNATPDSFYNKGINSDAGSLLREAEIMINEGAAILDIGGMSTRPDADTITVKEELDRTIPVIQDIKKQFPGIFISIDTYRSEVASEAVHAGADLVNDISAGMFDDKMYETVASLSVPYIAMHIQGDPKTMQVNPVYNDVAKEVLEYFIEKIKLIDAAGIKDGIIDPGFGFGKSLAHNYELLKSLHVFQLFEKPVMAGVSRKSMLYKLLGISPEEALNATTTIHMLALQQGACILRAHDVKAAVETIRLYKYYEDPV